MCVCVCVYLCVCDRERCWWHCAIAAVHQLHQHFIRAMRYVCDEERCWWHCAIAAVHQLHQQSIERWRCRSSEHRPPPHATPTLITQLMMRSMRHVMTAAKDSHDVVACQAVQHRREWWACCSCREKRDACSRCCGSPPLGAAPGYGTHDFSWEKKGG